MPDWEKWNKKEALKEISELIKSIEQIKASGRLSSQHTKWIIRCFNIFENIFGKNSMYYGTFSTLTWRQRDSF
jgi:hypothetical protein